jgi:Icc-related predicted phosphoesterase
METPYGEIPDNLAKGMRPQEMHDYLKKRYGRRTVLKGAAAAGVLAAAGPLFWRKADAFAAGSVGGNATTTTPQWIAYGPDPATTMWVSWSDGAYNNTSIPSTPLLQYADDAADLANNHGQSVTPSNVGQVPVPSSASYGTQPGGNADDTYYISAYLDGLSPETTYYYKVSNDGGSNWNSSAQFTTGKTGVKNFTFAATGDENENANTANVIASIKQYDPDFTIVAGDLSYASGAVEALGNTYGAAAGNTSQGGYSPQNWDTFFAYIGESAATIPWIVGVGNHEMEPLTAAGYAGVLTRFPDLAQIANGGSNTALNGSSFTYTGPSFSSNGYNITSGAKYSTGSPVVRSFTYGNVAFLQLDGNDLSAEITYNNGYTDGDQTSWLIAKLATYRAAGSNIDFVVVYFHNCPYCSNTSHGSDVGIRNVWQPIFDNFNVDLVINGHVHAYERSNPLYNNEVVKPISSGGSYTNFYTQQGALGAPSGAISGTTYICAGGGGQSLYTQWYGVSDDDGPAADETGDSNAAANGYATTSSPFIDAWEVGGNVEAGSATGAPTGVPSGDIASGGSNSNGTGAVTTSDPAYNPDAPYSAFRFSTWSHLVVNVTAPTSPGAPTSLEILSVDANVDPTVVQDSVTIIRDSVVQPPAATPEIADPALLVVGGAAIIGGAAYLAHRRSDPAGAEA